MTRPQNCGSGFCSCIECLYPNQVPTTIILDLPLPNSANTHWRHARGITYISKKGVDFRKLVADYVSEYRIVAPPGRLSVGIDIYPDSKRRMDIDNRIKPLLDALEHAGVMENDSLVDKLVVERKQILKGGKCRVFISEFIQNGN